MLSSQFSADGYDVVVIGSGIGGLTAGALLAKAGLRIAVVEAASVPGGYLSGFRRKDFRFDTAIHWLNQCLPGGMVYQIFDLLGNDYPRAIPQREIRRYLGADYDYTLTNNPDELKAQWQEEFPEDAAGIERFFAAAKRLGKAFAEFGYIFRAEETRTAFGRLKAKRKLLKFGLPFIPHLRYSGPEGVKKGLNKYFKSPKLHKVFASDEELLGCLVPIGWAYYGDYQSPPPGGGQVIAEWLIHVLQSFGGELHLKCRVENVLVEGKNAKGVRLHHRGKGYELAAKCVVAACDADLLYNQLLPPSLIPEVWKENLRTAPVYASSVTVSIALDCPPAALGFGEALVHLSATVPPDIADAKLDPATAEISILAPAHRDPSLAPAGQGTLVLFMPARMFFENEWRTEKNEQGKKVRGDAYKALKQEVAEAMIQRVSTAMSIDLKSHILFYDVATPVTHERYTGNAGGTMMGAKPGRSNMQKKVARYRTPLRNVFLGGHWAELGGGVPIAAKAGMNAALLALEILKPDTFRLLASYLDGKVNAAGVEHSGLLGIYHNDWEQKPTPAQKNVRKSIDNEEKATD